MHTVSVALYEITIVLEEKIADYFTKTKYLFTHAIYLRYEAESTCRILTGC